MALTPAQQQNLDRARYESGESFASNAAKISMQSEPALVIGLGGSGIDAMLRVKSKVHETFKTDIDPETGVSKSVPDNIRFLALDTDSRPLTLQEPGNPEPPVKYHYRGMYVEPSEQVYIGSSDFGAFLKNRHNLPGYITSWLSPTLNPVTNTREGAGGVRQCSRLLLFQNARVFTEKLYGVVRRLNTAAQAVAKPLSVYLFAGLSGGTGSGTFLDVAYLVHDAIKSAMGTDDVYGQASITAYLFMPDLYREKNQQAYIKYNGYAALKELDYLMGIENRKDHFHQQYSPEIIVDSTKPPFSLVHLLSSHFFETGAPVQDYYQKAMLIAAENVALWLSREGGNAAAGSTLSPKQYAANVNASIANLTNTLTNEGKLKTVGYCYGLLGASAKILPVRDIMICLCAELFQEMQTMYENNNPTEVQVATALGSAYFGLTEEHLVPELLQGTKKLADLLNGEAVQDMDTAFQSGGNSVLRAFDQRVAGNKNIIKEHVDDDTYLPGIEQRVQDELGKFFKNIATPLTGEKNPIYGPAFANGLLVGIHGSTTLCMTRYCHMKYDECTQRMQAIIDARPGSRSKLNKMLEEAKSSIFNKKKLYAEYLQAVVKFYQAEQSYALFEQMRRVYERINDFLLDQNNKIFGVIVDALTALRGIFAQNVEVMGNVDVRKTQEGAVLEWSVMPDLSEVKESVATMLRDYNIHLDPNKFYKFIWDNLTKWSAGTEARQFDAFGQVMDFVSQEFNVLLSEGLERYIQHEYEQTNAQHQRTFSKYIEEVLSPDMSSRAGIMFHTTVEGRQFLRDFPVPKREMALVPSRCLQIKSGIDQYGVSRTAADGTKLDTMFSDNNAQISWSKMVFGFPLFHYGLLKEYEKAYEDTRGQAGYNGTHIYLLTEKGQTDWRDLPALVPTDLDPAYRNESEVKRMERLTELYVEALGYGVIRRFGSNQQLTLMISEHNAVNKLMDEGRQQLESARLGNNLEAVTALKNQLGSYFTIDVDLPKPQPEINRELFQGEDEDAMGLPLRWFLTSYDLVIATQVECELFRKLKLLLDEVTALHTTLQSAVDAEQAAARKLAATMPMFVKALWSDTIYFEDGKYWYKPYVDPEDAADGDIDDDDDDAPTASANIELVKRTALPSEFASYREYALYYFTFVQGKVKENVRKRILKDAEERLTIMEDEHYSDEFLPKGNELRKKLKRYVSGFDLAFDEPSEEEKKLMDFYKKAYALVNGLVSD